MWEAILPAAIGAVVSIVVFYSQRLADTRQRGVELAERYEALATKEAEKREQLEKDFTDKIDRLNKQINNYVGEIADLRLRIAELERENADLKSKQKPL